MSRHHPGVTADPLVLRAFCAVLADACGAGTGDHWHWSCVCAAPEGLDRGSVGGERIRFTSAILPRFARRTRSLDAVLPTLYLRGVSSGDFREGVARQGLACRLRAVEHMTALTRKISWRRLRGRGLTDRKRGRHGQAAEVATKGRQSCRALPENGRAEAESAMNTFAAKYDAKYPQAVACLTKDRDALLAFSWRHIRTTNLRYRPSPHRAHQGLLVSRDNSGHGLQARSRRHGHKVICADRS